MARRKSSLHAHMKKGRAMAEAWFEKEVAARKNAMKKGGHIDPDVLLRRVIDKLPKTTMLSATIADYWLRWDKSTGAKRRKATKPKSVFSKTRPSVATKEKVLSWAYDWVLIVGAQAMLKEVRGVRNLVTISVRSQIEQKFPFLCFGAQVMGAVQEVSPAEFRQKLLDAPGKVSIRELTMEQALRRTWTDREARARWFTRWDLAGKDLVQAIRQAADDKERELIRIRSAIDVGGLLSQSGRKRMRRAKPVI